MNKGKRAWNQSNLSKPAADIDMRYGHNLLRQESEGWPPYAVVSTPSAIKAAEPHFGKQPAGVGYATHLDHGHLQEVSDGLTGGGRAYCRCRRRHGAGCVKIRGAQAGSAAGFGSNDSIDRRHHSRRPRDVGRAGYRWRRQWLALDRLRTRSHRLRYYSSRPGYT